MSCLTFPVNYEGQVVIVSSRMFLRYNIAEGTVALSVGARESQAEGCRCPHHF